MSLWQHLHNHSDVCMAITNCLYSHRIRWGMLLFKLTYFLYACFSMYGQDILWEIARFFKIPKYSFHTLKNAIFIHKSLLRYLKARKRFKWPLNASDTVQNITAGMTLRHDQCVYDTHVMSLYCITGHQRRCISILFVRTKSIICKNTLVAKQTSMEMCIWSC